MNQSLAFADAIVDTPSILQQLSQGPAYAAKAFFASTCLAILEVALTRVGEGGVRVVQMGRGAPKIIGISETPRKAYLPLFRNLFSEEAIF